MTAGSATAARAAKTAQAAVTGSPSDVASSSPPEVEVSCSQKICNALLDALGMLSRAIRAFFASLFWLLQRSFYHVKETFFEMVDAWEGKMRPWKKRKAQAHVPAFRYGSVPSPFAPAADV
eukprot:TRINITY_DN28170_c0_g1_i1.p2 TRINITY_DN28170_c0_g1~~TRINITY_DN28170_c0_g1_i1.p2  ORF type:complete len:121 (-),score=28.13 TRINITY_DN28170_c0_g1_i1:85-447(-)